MQQRKGKYMAQALEALEEMVCSQLPGNDATHGAVTDYRAARDRQPQPDKRAFQRYIEPLLDQATVASLQDFKGMLRARFNALAQDATDLMALASTGEINGVALEQRDALSPIGRP